MKKIFYFLTSLLFLFSSAVFAESLNNLFHNAQDPVLGNPNGSVTVLEFFDYQCSHCVDMAPIVQSIISANPNLRVVMKDLPIRGPASELAGRAALAARNQGKYNEMNHALFAANYPLNEEDILKIAKSNGLNVDRFKKDMNSEQIKNQLQNNLELAQSLQLPGTPAFFIGKSNAKNLADVQQILGAMSKSELQEAIDLAGR